MNCKEYGFQECEKVEFTEPDQIDRIYFDGYHDDTGMEQAPMEWKGIEMLDELSNWKLLSEHSVHSSTKSTADWTENEMISIF